MVRRTVKPYPTRVVLPYDKIVPDWETSQVFLVCLNESQLELLHYLTQYARREVNWLFDDTGMPGYYSVPDSSEMALAIDMVDDLEGSLMSPICTTEIVDALEALTECVCSLQVSSDRASQSLPDLVPYVDNGDVTCNQESESMGSPVPPGNAPERCEYAQAVFQYTYHTYTETLLPFAQSTTDTLTSAIIAASAFGLVAGFIGIPVALLGTIVSALIKWGVSGSIEDFVTWMLGNKDEIVCILYDLFPDYLSASAAVKAYIDAAGEISYLDKLVLKSILGSAWHYTWIIQDHQENGTWDPYIVSGYCDDCEEVTNCKSVGTNDPDLWECWPGGCEVEPYGGSGSLVCITAGMAWRLEESIVCPGAGSWLQLTWYPRVVEPGTTARCTYGLKIVGTSYYANFGDTGDCTADVLKQSAVEVPSQFWNNECLLVIKQEEYACEPVSFCLLDSEP